MRPLSGLSFGREGQAQGRPWLAPVLLLVALAALMLLGHYLDRLAPPPPGISVASLGGWRRRVMESVSSLPADLGGETQPGLYPRPGIYERSVFVELRSGDRGATVIFTTDGSLPTPDHGAVYRQPLHLDVQQPGVTVIRAIQVHDGAPSPVTTGVYVVGLDADLPVLTLVAEPDDLWGQQAGILSNPSFRGIEWERPVLLTFFEGQESFAVQAGLRTHSSDPLTAPKQSLRLYFRGEYGAGRLEYDLFPDHPDQPATGQSYDRLLLLAENHDGWWTLFEDELVAQTAGALDLPVAQGRFVHVFINGRSWGIYRLTERVDRTFLRDLWGYRNADVVQEGAAREGSDEDWDSLVDWAVAQDLAEPNVFAHVDERLDLANVTDFAILQLYFGFSAEDLYAVRDRGGKWHFVHTGGGSTFARRPGEPPTALSSDDTDFALLLRALLDNAGFRRTFEARTIGLLNTVLAPDVMSERVRTVADGLASDIRYESARWPRLTEWADNVALLHTFVTARPAALRTTLARLLGLGDPVTLQLRAEPPDSGMITMGDLPLEGDGEFFQGSEVAFTAVPGSGFVFAGWEGSNAPADSSPVLVTVTDSNEIVARFRPIDEGEPGPYPNDVIITEFWINDNGTPYRTLDGRPLKGDWVELLVQRPAAVDLRNWRLTDNDTLEGKDEGSLIFPALDAFAAVPRGTVILILAPQDPDNARHFPTDDLDPGDGRMILYIGNGHLDTTTDPGFAIGTRNDNLVLLAPDNRQVGAGVDEVGVDFVAEGSTVTPYSFGILNDGVVFEFPFRRLGGDDGALFTRVGSNDKGADNWLVDPSACESGDDRCLDAVNGLTPGGLTLRQQWQQWRVQVGRDR